MPNWKTYESSVRLLSAILAAHPDLKLNYAEIGRAFGGDCTKSAINNRFHTLRTDAKRISDALAAGIDPGDLEIPREVAKYYGDCTVYSLDHRFREIKKTAASMRADGSGTIADKYEEGVTAKAVSTRFERLKKEPDWLGNSTNNGALNSAVPKAPRTPKTKKTAKKVASEDDNDDDEELDISPSKFTPKALNKTKGGRVTKARSPRKADMKVPTYVEEDADEDEENDDMYAEENACTIVVKAESNDHASVFSTNGNGHHNGNGYSNGHAEEDEDVFHEASAGQLYSNGYEDDAV